MLSKQEFDNLCARYIDLQLKADTANQLADEAKALVLAEVQQQGYMPKNAEQSRRIDGHEFVATVTTGTTHEVNAGAAAELELLLSQVKLPQVFRLLFARTVKYSLVKGADEVMKGGGFPKKHADRIRILWSQCFTVKAKSPSLKVETVATIEQREEKAAKKSKGKKAA